jgi:hypothetical protein
MGDLIDRIGIVNQKIWHLESDIRKGKLDGNLLEVGKRAIKIRDLNDERIQLKNAINDFCKTGFKETKVNHASAEI